MSSFSHSRRQIGIMYRYIYFNQNPPIGKLFIYKPCINIKPDLHLYLHVTKPTTQGRKEQYSCLRGSVNDQMVHGSLAVLESLFPSFEILTDLAARGSRFLSFKIQTDLAVRESLFLLFRFRPI